MSCLLRTFTQIVVHTCSTFTMQEVYALVQALATYDCNIKYFEDCSIVLFCG